MSERMFTVIVPQNDKKSLVYPPAKAKKAISTIKKMVDGGHSPIAKTVANNITEYLTHQQMVDIYSE